MDSAAAQTSERLLTRDLIILIISGFFALTGFGSTLPLVPRYVEGELGGSKVAVGVALGIFSISAIVARPLVGRLGDERGRRFIIVGGTALTAVTVAAHALATSLLLLYLVRLAMGVTQGAFFVGSATLVNDLAPVERRGEATNYFSVAVYGGMALGPLLGELVQRAYGFGAAFAAGGAALAVSSLLALSLPDDRRKRVPIAAPSSTEPAVAVATMPPPGLIHRAAVMPGLILMGGLVTFTALNGFMPLYVEEFDLGSAGTVLLIYGLLVLAMRVIGSKLPDRFGTLRMSTISLVGQTAGMTVMGLWASRYGLYLGAAILAVGGSFLYPTLLTAAVYRVAEHERARATSTFTLAFELSAGLGGPLLGFAAALFGIRAAFFGAALAALAALPFLLSWAARRPDALVPARA
ncbi:MAG: MFS transporter [Acidimicrobiia bacterium]|nr:MFS transporter [Acidimicrobiia bacterium]